MISMLWYMWLNESIIYVLKVEKVDLLPGSVFGGYSNNSRSHASLNKIKSVKKINKLFVGAPRGCQAAPTIYISQDLSGAKMLW